MRQPDEKKATGKAEEPVVEEPAAAETVAAPEVIASDELTPPPPPAPTGERVLTAAIALLEPERSRVLVAYADQGLNFRLRTKTGQTETLYHFDIPGSHGEQTFLTVTAEGKSFTTGQAAFLLSHYPALVEEVPGAPE